MKSAIVTGANGFVGSALVRELLDSEYHVYALHREGHADHIPSDAYVTPVPFQLSEAAELPGRIPWGQEETLFFHLAWDGSAGAARADASLQLRNAQYTADLLRAAAELGCRRFIAAGSIMEREAIAAAYTQGSRPGLGYIYGCGKLAAHVMCKSAAASLGVDLIWAEITNAYGPGETSPRLVNSTIRKCLRGEPPQFTAGTQNYDFIYIDDAARAFRLIGERGKPFHDYRIGSSGAKPLKEFLLEMRDAVAPDLEFRFGDVPFTGVSLPLSDFDCRETERDTGFRAEISFSEGCRRTGAWWKTILEREVATP